MNSITIDGFYKVIKVNIYNSFSKERIVLDDKVGNCAIGLAALYVVRNDFLEEEDFVYSDYDSFQVRPKALFKDSKGIFIKADKKTYLELDYIDWIKKTYPEFAKYFEREN